MATPGADALERRPSRRDPRGAEARFVLREGEKTSFVLRARATGCAECQRSVRRRSEATKALRGDGRASGAAGSRAARTGAAGARSSIARRSLLKLLTFDPTGAIVAAPTCSLPEELGGSAQLGLPLHVDPRRGVHAVWAPAHRLHRRGGGASWSGSRLAAARRAAIGPLQIVYGIDGRSDLDRVELDHLDGYRGSRPGAHRQRRVRPAPARHLRRDDGLGLSLQQVRRRRSRTSCGRSSRRLLDWVCDNWRREDEGIWETRGGRRQFVYSKLMCWVALDRGAASRRQALVPGADRGRWLAERDAIYEDIMTHGWSDSARRSSSTTAARPSTRRTCSCH